MELFDEGSLDNYLPEDEPLEPLGFDEFPFEDDEPYGDIYDPYDYYTDLEDEIDHPSTFD